MFVTFILFLLCLFKGFINILGGYNVGISIAMIALSLASFVLMRKAMTGQPDTLTKRTRIKFAILCQMMINGLFGYENSALRLYQDYKSIAITIVLQILLTYLAIKAKHYEFHFQTAQLYKSMKVQSN